MITLNFEKLSNKLSQINKVRNLYIIADGGKQLVCNSANDAVCLELDKEIDENTTPETSTNNNPKVSDTVATESEIHFLCMRWRVMINTRPTVHESDVDL